MIALAPLAALALAASTAPQPQPSPPGAAPAAAPRPVDPAAGERLAAQACGVCHSTAMLSQQRLTPAQWQASVKKMRGWGAQLEDAEADLLARYLASRYGVDAPEPPVPVVDAAAAAAALAPQQDGRLAGGDPALGAKEFATLCAPCHGKDARGSHPGPNLVDRPILYRAQDVAAIVHDGRGQMPPQGVTDEVIAAIVAWLRTLERQ